MSEPVDLNAPQIPRSDSPEIAFLDRSLTAAQDEVARICKGRFKEGGRDWTMCIPVKQDDSDIVLCNGLLAGHRALAALRGAVEERDNARAGRDGARQVNDELHAKVAALTEERDRLTEFHSRDAVVISSLKAEVAAGAAREATLKEPSEALLLAVWDLMGQPLVSGVKDQIRQKLRAALAGAATP